MKRNSIIKLVMSLLAITLLGGCGKTAGKVREADHDIVVDDVFAYANEIGISAMILDRGPLLVDQQIPITVAITNQSNQSEKEVTFERGGSIVPKALHIELPQEVSLVENDSKESNAIEEELNVLPGATVTFIVPVVVSEPGDYMISMGFIDDTKLKTSVSFTVS